MGACGRGAQDIVCSVPLESFYAAYYNEPAVQCDARRSFSDIKGEGHLNPREDRTTEDAELIRLFLKRDEAALKRTNEAYGTRLKRLAKRLLRDDYAAEECVSDALFEAWNSIPPNEPYGHLFAYIGRIVRCRAIDRAERSGAQKRSVVLVELTHEIEEAIPSRASVEDEASANELKRLINSFLASQPKEKRDIFVLRYWFMEPVKDIANKLGKSESSVKMTLLRLRGELKDHLKNNGYEV